MMPCKSHAPSKKVGRTKRLAEKILKVTNPKGAKAVKKRQDKYGRTDAEIKKGYYNPEK